MSNPLLSNFELEGQKIDIRDSDSYEMATAAQKAADTANATAQSAQKAANEIISGFNTQFVQTIGEYISPYFCKRNNTVYVEFPNIASNKIINHTSWVTVCHTKTEHKPMSTVYREISVDGTVTVLVEISTSGSVKMYSPTTDIPPGG